MPGWNKPHKYAITKHMGSRPHLRMPARAALDIAQGGQRSSANSAMPFVPVSVRSSASTAPMVGITAAFPVMPAQAVDGGDGLLCCLPRAKLTFALSCRRLASTAATAPECHSNSGFAANTELR